MKILEVYDKNSDIRCRGKNIFKTMDTFFMNYPQEYSECYYRNLETLKLFKTNKLIYEHLAGYYYNDSNIIFFKEDNSLGHELFHVSSNDIINNAFAISSKMAIESGLIEGMTEYLFNKLYGLSVPTSYPFEVFVVKMLEDIPRLFEPYFIPNHDKFISLFPNKRDIYSLLYSIDAYNDSYLEYEALVRAGDEQYANLNEISENVKDTIDSLISVELSINGDNKNKLSMYRDKFMDLIRSNYLIERFKDIYPDYDKYAEIEIKKRIKERM